MPNAAENPKNMPFIVDVSLFPPPGLQHIIDGVVLTVLWQRWQHFGFFTLGSKLQGAIFPPKKLCPEKIVHHDQHQNEKKKGTPNTKRLRKIDLLTC